MTPGLAGGYPSATSHDVLMRGTNVRAMLARGRIPSSLEEIDGEHEMLPPHVETDMAAADVYYTHWQGGGGYGDPLRRNPEKVAADLAAFRISAEASSQIYGVVMAADGKVDNDATEKRRQQLRYARISLDVE